MKSKNLLISIVFLGIIFSASMAMAKVNGACVNCHTMHSSQSPEPTVWTEKGWDATSAAQGALVVGGCVSCHTAPSGTQNMGSNDIPYVDQITAPNYGATGTEGDTLAGGTFYHVYNGGTDAKGHNVAGITGISADGDLPIPPGFDDAHSDSQTNTVAGGAWTSGAQVTCAGTYGCHGTHDVTDQFAAVRYAHHADDTTIDGTTVGKSYRMLIGIKGIECNTDTHRWEYQPTVSVHNQYYGIDGNTVGTNKQTISYLCAECHGVFHATTNGVSPWVRHPTDFDLGSAEGPEYKYYNGNTAGGAGAAYSVVAPVASDLTGGVLSTVDPSSAAGTAIVTCISCHRAHGTKWDDLLRWDYDTMIAGQGTTPNTGCFICHTTK